MQSTRRNLILWLSCGLLLVAPGCGSSDGPAKGVAASGAATATATQDESGIKYYSPDKLPAVEYNLAPQDNGRLEVPTPAGWSWGSKKSGTIIWFYEKDRSGLPRILITGEPCQHEGVTAVTKANVWDFSKRVAAELEEKEQEVQEEPRALMLGEHAWVRYVLLGKHHATTASKATPVDRQILRTVVGGREYVVELQVIHKKMLEHRDSAYALAAGIKFHPAGTAAPPPETAPESPPPGTAEPNQTAEPAQ